MKHVSLNETYAREFVSNGQLYSIMDEAISARDALVNKIGLGKEMTGWVDFPVNYDKNEFERIKKAAKKIRKQSKVLVVIGIGGSYLGARAAIEFLKPSYSYGSSSDLDIYYAGNMLSSDYGNHILKLIGDRDFSVNVISKSGTTLEPAIAFRFFKEILEEKYGKEGAADRIYATTDKVRGALKNLADTEGYETFVVPDDIGGRYSVLSSVGLLPIAAAGCDIDALMAGAANAREDLISSDFESNAAMRYAAYRNYFFRRGKFIEILANYGLSLKYVQEWWKQLFGESEGKEGKGIFPTAVNYTTELHSIGQFIQDGPRIFIETVLNLKNVDKHLIINETEDNLDNLNYLAGKTLSFVNNCAIEGTAKAHSSGDVPVFLLDIDKRCEEALGELFYFFEFSCAISGYMLGVNPFDQPGVEEYKRNMFELLGKPGM